MDHSLANLLSTVLKLVFGGLALLFVSVSIGFSVRNLVILNTYQHSVGEVVSSRSTGSGRIASYDTTVRYSGPSGIISSGTGEVFFSYATGDRVDVYYDPESVRDFYISSIRSFWFLPILFGVLGAIVSYFLIRMIIDDRKALRKAQ
ncbi:MAG: DUF3592 domain-containing protein [Acidobacteria bacterium]|nr:DUF3592 domain-containing protein [Acidobacteriota bacterium]